MDEAAELANCSRRLLAGAALKPPESSHHHPGALPHRKAVRKRFRIIFDEDPTIYDIQEAYPGEPKVIGESSVTAGLRYQQLAIAGELGEPIDVQQHLVKPPSLRDPIRNPLRTA